MSDIAGKIGNYITNFTLVFSFDMNDFGCITSNCLLISVCSLYEFVPV
jgi:hypothetical protein